MQTNKQRFNDEIRALGYNPDEYRVLSVDDGRWRIDVPGGTHRAFDQTAAEAARSVTDSPAPGAGAEQFEDIAVAADDGLPDPSTWADAASEFNQQTALLESDRTFISEVNGRRTLSLYETAERETRAADPITYAASGGDMNQNTIDIAEAITGTPSNILATLSPDVFQTDADLTEAGQERDVRRETREAARDAAEAAGVDLDEFGIGATAEGEVILQDRDTNQTRTIDPEGDLGSAIDQQTDGGSFEPTSSSSSNDTTSNVPSVDDLGGGRLAAAVGIGAAVLYGVTQS